VYALATIGSIHTYGLLPPQRIEITPYPKTSGLPVLSGESPDCPSLRASNEHILIVRVLRARRMVWRLPLPFQACSLSLQGWGLIDLPLRATFSPAHPPADIFHPPYPPIASQSISRDVPLALARAFGGRALREHRKSSASIPSHACPSPHPLLELISPHRPRLSPFF